jgi:hypothetical protein
MLDANCNTSLTRKTVHPNRRYTQKISNCFIQGSMARRLDRLSGARSWEASRRVSSNPSSIMTKQLAPDGASGGGDS